MLEKVSRSCFLIEHAKFSTLTLRHSPVSERFCYSVWDSPRHSAQRTVTRWGASRASSYVLVAIQFL